MSTTAAEAEERAYAKVTWRLLPFLGACYLIAYLDRVNVSFAKLHMLADLEMSEAAYGFGAGVFFVGYFLFEVPSNLALHRVGARIWIARIMLTWGLVSGAMAFTGSFAQLTGLGADTVFYALRFLLGIAEAGFFPGVLLYLNYWYPSHRQSRAVALLLAAQPLSFVLGAPISGAIMQSLGGAYGLYDWQWLFLLEAAPAIVFAHRRAVLSRQRHRRRAVARGRRQEPAERTAGARGASEERLLAAGSALDQGVVDLHGHLSA